MIKQILTTLSIPAQKHRRGMVGAALAEYLPILSVSLLVGLAGAQTYGPALKQHVGEMASQLASNYYQGWFYPKETAGLAPMGGGSSSSGSGGPSAGEGSDGQDGSGGESEDGGVGGIGGDYDNPGSEDPFNPKPGGEQSCAADTGGGSGNPLSSPSASSAASTNTAFGNPIDIGTGNKFQREFDYRHAGVTPLVFERYYNSLQSPIRSKLGYGWRHSYSRQLLLPHSPGQPENVTATVTPPRPSSGSNTLKMLRDDGTVYVFNRDGKHWQGDGVVDRLIEAAGGWLYTTVNGVVERYNSLGLLKDVRYPNGITHTLTYDEQSRLASITDSRGPALQLHYKQHWLSRVSLPDGDQLRFRYSNDGNLQAYQRSNPGLWASLASLVTANTAEYHYEDKHFAHTLTGLTDAEGQRYATWAYDHLGRAILSQHGDGAEKLTFDYRRDGTVAMTNAAGRITVFHLEPGRPGYRRLVSTEGLATPSCGPSQQALSYNAQGFIKLAVDANGHATRYTRNARGLVEQREEGLTWPRQQEVHGRQGAQEQQENQWQADEGARRLEQQWHPDLPLITRATYSTYINGQWQSYLRQQYDYSDAGRLLTRTDTDLSQQSEPYSTYGEQRSWSYTYHFVSSDLAQPTKVEINGPLPAQSDGSDDITRIAYNREGLIQSITNPLGQTTRITAYNRHGQPTAAELPNGIQVSLSYDAYHHLDTLTRQGGDLTETLDLDIDRNGLLYKLTLPDGSWQQFEYNAARQLTGLTNQLGDHLSIAPSPVNGAWTEQVIYNEHDRVERQYQRQLDSLGRVIKFLGQQGQQTQLDYSPGGQLTQVQEQGNRDPSQYHYDALNRLSHTLDALQGRTHIDYGLQGQIQYVTDAGGSKTDYRYNGFGEAIWQRSDASGEVALYRDSAGRVVRQQGGNPDSPSNDTGNNANGIASVHYHYDLLGRLTLADYPGTTEDIHYGYDQISEGYKISKERKATNSSLGQLTSLRDSSGSQTYTHDALGRVITDTRTGLDGKPTTITYRYNPKSQLAALVYPNGAEIHYHYRKGQLESLAYQDATGKHHKIVDDIAYHAFGGPKGWRYGNGLEYKKEIDLDGRVSSISLVDIKSVLWRRDYEYDNRDNIHEIVEYGETGNEGVQTTYDYDDMGRLTEERASEEQLDASYEYDAAGNRRTRETGHDVERYHYDAGNRLSQHDGSAYRYDAKGNLLQWLIMPSTPSGKSGQKSVEAGFIYNKRGRQIAYLENNIPIALYLYSALGQRTEKRTEHQYHRYLYNLNGELIGERIQSVEEGNAQPQESLAHEKDIHWIWLGGAPVAQIRIHKTAKAPHIVYLHSDHLNTPRLASNANKKAVWFWRSDAFGVGLPDEDPDKDGVKEAINLRFPGQYYDQESGLHYNFFRYYQPETGRYTQSDPIGLQGDLNTYAYVGGNPVEWADPLGLARLQYIMIDNYGGDPLNSASNTLKAGVDPRLQHFAFYLTDIAGAPGQAMIYDPNGTFSSVNQNGAVGWDSLTGPNYWQSFQSHYSGSLNTGTWASVNNFDDNQAAKLFEELVGYNPVSSTPAPGTCPTPPVGLASLPDLPQGFYAIENYAFPSYVHLLTKPTFFASDMPSENDTRYVDLVTVPWGDAIFQAEGNDTPGSRDYTRVPHIPNNKGVVVGDSGVTIGRGYDLGFHNAQQIRSILTRVGVPQAEINLLAGAAGLKQQAAYNYYKNTLVPVNITFTREQQYLIYLQAYYDESKHAERLYNNHVKNGGTDWDKLDPLIRETLVDLKFRGDFKNVSATNPVPGLTGFAQDFRDAARGNSVKDMCIVMSSINWKDAKWPPGSNPPKGIKVGELVWGVPKERFDKRIKSLSSGTGICQP